MQQIVDDDPEKLVLALAAIAGFAQWLDRASYNNAADTISPASVSPRFEYWK